MTSTMQAWIASVITQTYGTAGNLASRIGMTDSGFGRAVEAGTFQIENILRLARETHTPPGYVFQLADKTHIHDLIVSLYGDARIADADTVEIMSLFRALPSDEMRASILGILRESVRYARRRRPPSPE